MSIVLNDVHSLLNPTLLAEVRRPRSLEELRQCVTYACAKGLRISTSGGRHAMGGQQFAAGSLHVDTTCLARVLHADSRKGLLTIEAGADWPAIIAATHGMDPLGTSWGIRQKQTGVDTVTLGGSISANAHGRGLLMQPLGADIEELTLVRPDASVVRCNSTCNSELFSLVVGGYGLFGIIYSATLRLAPRLRVRRLVDIIDLDDAMNAVYRRAGEGCLFGDFQFVIDGTDEAFLRRGVMACYKPCEEDRDVAAQPAGEGADLSREDWLRLLKLAHEDKRRAFRLYSQHYLATDGNFYWSDTHQLSTYIPTYTEVLAEGREACGGDVRESLLIGEHYVPPARLLEFMSRAREVLRSFGTEVIYGTIRAIQQDTVSFLPWAREDFACVIFNLRTSHDPAGLERTAATFRALIEASAELGGSYFLTYHRHASVAQVEACHPRFREFLAMKKKYDPGELFTSDWYCHYRDEFARTAR